MLHDFTVYENIKVSTLHGVCLLERILTAHFFETIIIFNPKSDLI